MRRPDDETAQRLVRLVGFGIEQLDAMMNGIWGNGPGSAYAIGDITPIFYNAPVIAPEAGVTFQVLSNPGEPQFTIQTTDPQQLKIMLDAVSKVGVNTATLQLTLKDRKITRQLAWIKLADDIPFTFTWDKTMPDAIRLACTTEYPDPRMAKCSVTFKGQKLESFPELDGSRILRIPRNDKLIAAAKTGKLSFKVVVGNQAAQTFALEIAAKDRVNGAPALMKLDGFTPFFTSFEDGPSSMLQFANFPRMRVENDPSNGQSHYLMVRNTGYGQALETNFNMAYSIAQYPIVQFRYRAWDMAQISLRFSRSESHYVRLANDDYSSSVAVRAGKDFILDEQWHSWTGVVSDAFTSNSFNTARYLPTRMRFGSVGSPDQTGRFSKFALDDLIAGPAAHTIDQISFTPTYFDADGVKDVFFGMTHVNSPYYDLTPAEQQAIVWTRVEPGAKIVPPAEGLKPGINHIVLKAKDIAGVESNVMDLPFLWDTTNLTVSHAVQDSAVDYHNKKSLVVTFADSGLSPVAVEKLKFFVQDTSKAATIPAWSNYLQHTMGGNALHLNMNHAFLFRNYLDKSNNGDTFNLVIDGIEDGAGNKIPAYTASFKVDYASDKTGPNWYDLKFGSSVGWYWNWDE